MSRKYMKVVNYCFCIVLLFLFCSVVGKGITRGLLHVEDEKKVSEIDWEQKFPFQEPAYEKDMIDIGAKADDERNKIVSLHSRIKATVEWYCTDGFWGQQKCIEAVATVNKLIGNRYMRNKRIIADIGDGYLTTMTEQIDTQKYADNVIGLNEFCDKNTIPFLYIESIYKISKTESSPFCIDDYTNDNADNLIEQLQEKDVAVIDLRERVSAEEHRNLFFKTDTHWKPETALWAAQQITKEVQLLDTELLSENNACTTSFQEKIFKTSFLGAFGRDIGLGYAEPEDFAVIFPQESIQYQYIAPALALEKQGTFEEALIDWSVLETKDYYNSSSYSSYMYSRQPYAELINKESDNDTTILFLSDSFGSTVAPFLSLGVQKTIFVDPRLFTGSIETVIATQKPDIVIAMYNPEVITSVSASSNDSIYMLK